MQLTGQRSTSKICQNHYPQYERRNPKILSLIESNLGAPGFDVLNNNKVIIIQRKI